MRATSAATEDALATLATASGDSTNRYATFAKTYSTAMMSIPPRRASGRLRCGRFTSPATIVTLVQPS